MVAVPSSNLELQTVTLNPEANLEIRGHLKKNRFMGKAVADFSMF